MIKWLIKSTEEIRVENEDDANQLHKEIEQFAHDNDYILNTWTQTYKSVKLKGELVDEYWLCKYTLIFNEAKTPTIPLKDIKYNMFKEDVPFEGDTVVSAF